MKRFLSIRILMLTALVSLAAVNASANDRPFALNGNGLATFLTDGAGNITGANVTASGNATHLGLWTTVGSLQFTPDPNNPGVILATGQGTIIAANGDNLDFVLENSALNVVTGQANGNFRFTGGTGRFQNATGTAPYVVSQNLATGAFQLTAVGTLNF